MSERETLFDARRLDRIRRHAMSNEEAEAAVRDIALMQQALQVIASGAESNPPQAVARMAENVLAGGF